MAKYWIVEGEGRMVLFRTPPPPPWGPYPCNKPFSWVLAARSGKVFKGIERPSALLSLTPQGLQESCTEIWPSAYGLPSALCKAGPLSFRKDNALYHCSMSPFNVVRATPMFFFLCLFLFLIKRNR